MNYNPKDLQLAIYDPLKLFNYCWLSFPHFFEDEVLNYFTSENEFLTFNEQRKNKEIINIIIENNDLSLTTKTIYYYRNSNDVNYYVDGENIVNVTAKKSYKTDYLYLDRYHYCSFFSDKFQENVKDVSYNALFGVDSLMTLNLENLYTKEYSGLRADFAYNDKGILPFDLSEKAMGPHGLVAGTTGAGKSELLCSLLLSLCTFNSANKCNIVIIDYKGGSLVSELSFEGKALPHIVGTITNLDQENQERLAYALKSECEEREKLFALLAKRSGESISNLEDYRYQSIKYHFPNKAHLVIVVDEFAQLKKETPAFLDILLALSRIGRSLGIHLILATQKPTGVVNEEILANSHFRIALKTLDRWDSLSIIGSSEAFNLHQPGEFYLRKDNLLLPAKAFYTKEKIGDKNFIYKCDNTFRKIMNVNESGLTKRQFLVQNIIKYYSKTPINQLFNSLSSHISFKEIDKKYLITSQKIIIGEIDDYKKRKHYLAEYDCFNSLLIWGEKEAENLILFNALKNKKRVIGIGNNLSNSKLYCDILSYNDNKLNILANQILAMYKSEDIYLYVENIGQLLAFNGYWRSEIKRILLYLKQLKIGIACAINDINYLPFSLISCFNERINLKPLKKEEALLFYNCGANFSASCLDQKEVKPLIPLKPPSYKLKGHYSSYFPLLPPLIKPIKRGEQILLGYSKKTHLAIYVPANVLLLAQEEKNFKFYRGYKGAKFVSTQKQNVPNFLPATFAWIGVGNYKQQYFKTISAELKENEVLYMHNNEMEVLWGIGTRTT